MIDKLIIIGDIADKDRINSFCSQLKGKGVESEALYPATDFMSHGTALCCPVAVLWISSNSNEKIFNIAGDRQANGNVSINFFADGVTLSDAQKSMVGRNHSVFASIDPENWLNDIVNLLPVDLSENKATSLSPGKPLVSNAGRTKSSSGSAPKIKKVAPAQVEQPSIQLSDHDQNVEDSTPKVAAFAHHDDTAEPIATSMNSEAVAAYVEATTPEGLSEYDDNTSLEYDDDTSFEDEEERKIRKRILWRPWIWMAAMILWFGLMFAILAHDDILIHSKLFVFMALGFLIIPCMIIVSTFKAIKISKWALLVIPIALIIIYLGLDFFSLMASEFFK